MTQETLTLRLQGTDVPPGEIALADLASLAEALHLLTHRIGRDLAGHRGPGRSTAATERATRLTLIGITEGSTRLHLVAGAAGTLPATDPLEAETMDRVWQIFTGLSTGHRPDWVTPLVGSAVLSLVNSLGASARSCEFSGHGGIRMRQRVVFAPAQIDRAIWTVVSEPQRLPRVRVTGHLYLVDLRARRFRIRDDVGNDIALEDVENTANAGTLVGQRVTAVGAAELGARGQITRLVGPEVAIGDNPIEWREATRTDFDALFAGSEGPAAGGVPGVDDDEVEAFLATIRS